MILLLKKTSLFVLFAVFSTGVFSQTASEVIDKFIVASGGKEKLQAINTLQYSQVINMKTPMGNLAVPMQFFKEKNKLFRMQASMQFGPQALDFFTLVTDTAGYIMLPAIPMLGTDGGVQKMTEKDRAAQAFQLDPAGLFAGLVNFAAKGNKVALLPAETVNGQDCYKLTFASKDGIEATYFISKANNLVVKTNVKGEAAASMTGLGSLAGGMNSQVQKAEVVTVYSDYQEVGGVKFPTKAIIQNQMGDAESTIANIKVNEPIDAKWYKAQ